MQTVPLAKRQTIVKHESHKYYCKVIGLTRIGIEPGCVALEEDA